MSENFQVKVGEFEGPLDLLLNLIEKRKLHISQVSLAQVADDYIGYLKTEEGGQSMGAMANFIMVASTLMLIKSLALLPGLQINEEEKNDISNLEDRLKQLQRIRELSLYVKEKFGERIIFLPTRPLGGLSRSGGKKIVVFSPTQEITIPNLVNAIKDLLKNLPKPEIIPEKIIKKVISLEEVISDLANRVSRAMKMSFNDFVNGLPTQAGKAEKVNIIVSFLGMLELVKQGAIEIEQKAHFADINMETKTVGIPRY
ncbi:MAG TPA: segregation/condensation protein A [Candidatus Paceibacterota bacterium]|nr:segregation/condensation protein A [Candidatus Paceibacterota bacterium]